MALGYKESVDFTALVSVNDVIIDPDPAMLLNKTCVETVRSCQIRHLGAWSKLSPPSVDLVLVGIRIT